MQAVVSPERQLEELLRTAGSTAPAWTMYAVLLLALGAALGATWTAHPLWFVVCAFLALLAWSIGDSVAHLRRAAQAATQGWQRDGRVRIEVTTWTESRSYEAVVLNGTQVWRFEFAPMGWTPQEGEFVARFHMLPGTDWPALVRVEAGLLVPRRRPVRLPQ
jgi:hypothetical protein